LERQLRMAQKMEAVGRLSGGIAHDFNNLLGVIIGYRQVLKRGLGSEHASFEHAQEIEKAGQRAVSLTRQLLAFSRQQVLEPVVLNLNTLISDMEKLLPRLIGEDIALKLELDSSLLQVRADPSQIEQVLMNLAVNARDAMPDGGTLLVQTANVTLDTAYAHDHPGSRLEQPVAHSIAPPATAPANTGGTETILLVEDAEPLRKLAEMFLKECGYLILSAADGQQALHVARQHFGPIALLLTDVVMPGMNGRVLRERLAPSQPGMKVLHMSGYTDAFIAGHGVLEAGTHLLHKPFTQETLTRKVRELLDAGRNSAGEEKTVDSSPVLAGAADDGPRA
jgi:two-component system cell cycle sensor histidine kinase/response regulator CckA